MKDVLLKDFKPTTLLKRPNNTPEHPRFPAIDAHNHLFGDITPEEIITAMDAAGVKTFVNVTGNTVMPYENNCYTIKRRDFSVFVDNFIKPFPGRFAAFTMSDFAQWGDPILIKDKHFADRCISQLEADVALGACGLKITKELGLYFRDYNGELIAVNDKRLFPIWKRAGELGIPVLMHVSDPAGYFLPVDHKNEHYLTMREFPAWSWQKAPISKWELLVQRDRLVASHPNTKFILPHGSNNPEDLDYVAGLLDLCPNVYIDFSARIDEFGRQPYSARSFFIAYQDRILFATDTPPSPDVYRCYFRFLETNDEYFDYPDYIGRWGYSRWRIYGIHLPENVLRKVYSENAKRIIPGLK